MLIILCCNELEILKCIDGFFSYWPSQPTKSSFLVMTIFSCKFFFLYFYGALGRQLKAIMLPSNLIIIVHTLSICLYSVCVKVCITTMYVDWIWKINSILFYSILLDGVGPGKFAAMFPLRCHNIWRHKRKRRHIYFDPTHDVINVINYISHNP